MKTSFSITVVCTLVAPLARADVIVVDPAGGPGGALLQSAVNAAQNDDILLLRPGDYTDADISTGGRRLNFVADAGGLEVKLSRLAMVFPSGSNGSVLVRGLSIAPPPLVSAPSASGLDVHGTIGSTTALWVEDCTIGASQFDGPATGFPPSRDGAGIALYFVSGAVVRSTATGADGFDQAPGVFATGGGSGLDMLGGGVTVCESTLTGGAGGDGLGDNVFSTDGGPGLSAVGVPAVMGSSLQGGDEGADNGTTVKPGAGLRLDAGLAAVRDSDVQPGALVGGGTPNVPVYVSPNGSVQNYLATTRSLAVNSPVREGEFVNLSLSGEPGDGVWLYVAEDAGFKLLSSKQGSFMLGAPLPAPLFLGTISASSGELALQSQVPDLLPGMDGTILYLQAVMTPASGGLVAGSGSALVWIDSTL